MPAEVLAILAQLLSRGFLPIEFVLGICFYMGCGPLQLLFQDWLGNLEQEVAGWAVTLQVNRCESADLCVFVFVLNSGCALTTVPPRPTRAGVDHQRTCPGYPLPSIQ